MTVLGRALQIRKALWNVRRMTEISTLVTKYGFGEALVRLGLKKGKVSVDEDGVVTRRSAPERLRMLLENLGPTFIKLGQIAAGRPDLVPPAFLIELQKLQDRVEPIPYSAIKQIIEMSFHKPIEEMFASFDTLPLASASIAQVHTARTQTGEDVVVKIQKPEVERILHKDFEIVELLAELVEATIPEVRPFKPRQIIKEFRRLIIQEIDFEREARNLQKYSENFATSDFLVVPKVYKAYSTDRILTLERIQGFRVDDIEQYKKYDIDPKALLKKGLDHHMESLMVHGLFHADPHAGNMLVQPDGRLALLDFGSVGWLSARSRNSLVNLFLALVSEDYEALVEEYLELSPRDETNHSTAAKDQLTREVSFLMAPYYGMSLKEIPAAQLMLEASGLAFKYHIQLPQDLIAVFKSNMILEGIGRQLDPDFDLLDSAVKFGKRVLAEKIRPQAIIRTMLRGSRDVQRFIQKAPRLGLEILRQVESGQFEIKLKNPDLERLVHIEKSKTKIFTLSAILLAACVLLGLLINDVTTQGILTLRIAQVVAIFSLTLLLLSLFKRG